MKHTPGPWTVEFVQSWPFGVRVTSPSIEILSESGYCHSSEQKTRTDCEMGIGFPFKNGERERAMAYIAEQDANARLIAAAPELLLALETVLSHVEDEGAQRVGSQCTLCYTYRGMIREAIRKAKGE